MIDTFGIQTLLVTVRIPLLLPRSADLLSYVPIVRLLVLSSSEMFVEPHTIWLHEYRVVAKLCSFSRNNRAKSAPKEFET
jgi:hypothetical protein